MEESNKISEFVKLSQPFSTLQELSQQISQAPDLLEVLLPSDLKEPTTPSLWPSRIISLMLPEMVMDSKDISNKEVMLKELLLT